MPPSSTTAFSGIFVSYRRDDSSGHAGWLFEKLAAHFGRERIFMDIDAIEPGEDFVTVIEDAVGSCEILLAIIGRDWLSEPGQTTRRLDNPLDVVRLEIVTALKRDIRVIPVLVQRANMPKPEDLPDDLAKFARRNAIELNDHRWQTDVDELITVMDRVFAKREEAARRAEAAKQEEAERQREEEERQLRQQEKEARQRREEEQLREQERLEEERQTKLAEEAARQRAAEAQQALAEKELRELAEQATLEAAGAAVRQAEEERRKLEDKERRRRKAEELRRAEEETKQRIAEELRQQEEKRKRRETEERSKRAAAEVSLPAEETPQPRVEKHEAAVDELNWEATRRSLAENRTPAGADRKSREGEGQTEAEQSFQASWEKMPAPNTPGVATASSFDSPAEKSLSVAPSNIFSEAPPQKTSSKRTMLLVVVVSAALLVIGAGI